MKFSVRKLVVVIWILLLAGSCAGVRTVYYSSAEDHRVAILQHQQEMNEWFADPERSPLPAEEIPGFSGLPFFPIDTKYQVKARLVRTPEAKPFQMPTTTDRLPVYRCYGIIAFEIEGQKHELRVYQNLELTDPNYRNYLFLPFRDATSGVESYGGGRYLDLKIPKGKELVVDFNRTYNPYCAYNDRYSCPIPPVENTLDIAIEAGIKAPKK